MLADNVFLLIPNLIGYMRIGLAVSSLYFMPIHPRTCTVLYSVSCLLDAVDGMAARKFNQASQFGAVLDMTIDRCTTSCLLVFLAVTYPQWSILFQCLISLDFSSHYMHMYATLAMGAANQSHKNMDENRPWVMRIYYSNTNVLFVVCLFNELFFIALYLLSFSTNVPSWIQPQSMEMRSRAFDSTVPWTLMCVSAVFMLFKQYVNVVQMVEACKWIAEGDAERRKRLKTS
ncbi:phosphatidylinositol synthase [Talaromyces proteolyticus]|uniref:CDP-diacylglycerol--inositol 3-phosphatidyltransferase n=1 Tax=Talaromyces proteolyticus TaxID=1131652 RepID=A0AAD4KV63_9EURO|nr:phosphatidylinositol synthase [Talaromyces proteolyticus]KAH8700576.1 phosphatidylinositol synthase [Talaromyces proteolyticus]